MIEQILHWLVETIGSMGYTGIVVLMAIESSFIPLPSEIVLPPAGYLASQGKMDLTFIIIAGTFGSLLGAYANYFLARKFGRPLFGVLEKYIGVSKHHLEKTEVFFQKHGEISTFVGRLLPVIRHLISLPAGIARMNLKHFTVYTLLGAAIWSTVLTLLGYYVGKEQELLHAWMKEITIITLIACALLIGIYVWWNRKKAKKTIAQNSNVKE